jgi:transposase
MGAKRPDVDWVAIQAIYRSDQLSTREIARRYEITEAAIRAKAKTQGWNKDLAAQVATGVKDAVLRSSFAKVPSHLRNKKGRETTEKAVVAAAIEEGRQVVVKHQHLGKLLSENSQSIAEIIRDEIAGVRAALDEGPSDDLEPKDQIRKEVALTKRLTLLARAHDSLTRAAVNSITIERQSRGLDDQPADPNAPPSISITYYRSDLTLQKIDQGGGV